MNESNEKYSVEQIRQAFAKHASLDSWSVPSFYENILIDSLRGKYDGQEDHSSIEMECG